jgi:2-polyprenyl-3-methyl-5-hydroxy-6-metoxy-1,4-benzoquinol methylase
MADLTQEHDRCLLCQHGVFKPFAEMISFGYPVRYVQCTACGLVQQPPDVQAADHAFYEETYRTVYQSAEEPIAKDLKIQQMRADHLVTILQACGISDVECALDIGASAGVLLDTYHEAYLCDTIGIEPGRAYAAFAANKGHQMFSSVETLAETAPERFNLVSMIHVAEHLSDPLGMLTMIRTTLLADDGWLLLEVPNFFAHDSYELAHLACYTPHSLRQLVKKAGFDVIYTRIHGVPRSELLGLYVTVLAKVSNTGERKEQVKPEKWVKTKRMFAMARRRVIQKLFPQQAWLPLPE